MNIKLRSSTHGPSGKRRTWTRTLKTDARTRTSGFCGEDGRVGYEIGLASGSTVRYIESNLPSAFYGCEVTIESGTTKTSGIIDPDTRTWSYCK